jgi:integrase
MNNYAKIVLRSNFVRKDGLSPIYLRLTLGRQVKPISLFKYIEKKYWDEAKGLVKNEFTEAEMLNKALKSYLKKANDIIYEYEIKDKTLTYDEFVINFKKQKTDDYFDFVSNTLKNNINTNYYSKESLRTQFSELSKLKKYRKTLRLSEITTSFLSEYEGYMRNVLKNKVNTIHKSLKIMRSHINNAILIGLLDENVFKKYKLRTERTKREFLTQEELKKLQTILITDLKNYEKNARRIFLFCCYTGLRYGDIKNLTTNNIQNDIIYIKMHKTGEIVSIPLNNYAKQLIPQHTTQNSKIFKVPNNQAFNRILKELMKKVEIKKTISSHSARHTFATLSIHLGIPIEIISKLLGHTNIKTTQLYIKIADTLKIKEMEKWNLDVL